MHITGRRENGYHELQTIFQLIDLYDWMTFTPISEDEIQIEGLGEVQLEQNLIYRAAQILRPHAQNPCGLHIKLKNIPMGAGLGGGSSNAATTLIVLNQLWQCGLTEEQLAQFGVKLGADVPILFMG